jgi:branched-chain amino acid transport system substrate-binding protein
MRAKGKAVLLATCTALAALVTSSAGAEQVHLSHGEIKIGVLTDMSSIYSTIGGRGAVQAVKMAADDFMKENPDIKVEVVYADHQSKADIAAIKAREWFDRENVDMVTDLTNSSVAFAVIDLARQRNKIAIATGPASSEITNAKCTPVSVQYVYDTYALGRATAHEMMQQGGKTWYFVAADYAFGKALVSDASNAIKTEGGSVLGTVWAPMHTADFSTYLMQAQSSGAKVVGLANAGGDFVNAMKAAEQFGLTRTGGPQLAGLLVFLADVHAIGLQAAQGLEFSTAFYWDRNEETRNWSKRFLESAKRMPEQTDAGDYSSTMHYLRAVKAAGTDETGAVMKKMREMPVNDFFTKNGRIREDGLMVHDMYLVQVKKPSESKYPWDYYTVKAVIPGEQAFRPLSESGCALVKK